MVRHIVMWTLKEEAEGNTAAVNGAKMKEILEALAGRIEGLRHIEVSVDIVAADPECHVVLCSEHDDVAALDHYQGHPEHQACVAFVKKVAASRKALDYII
ncbi:MAG: Dabb family protein [Pseudodesulfovibrio sp.]|uniref:Stress responsive alpha/beta barrel protein n=1 Tax=Pseudodesulfovibrio indicus TaxID=1716143 RepID=A0A126QN78_9BACT|nr:Dabb family protein [Pseudodesulfovibrio indicus]AMK11279.1 stress responsive protein [Pseudodesulfovibrio indicus]TDT85573.1 stress responsive alpha/beta barrel protein [Pseudodesulfovibrio indicus]